VIDIIAQGVQATVDPRIRETITVVKELDTPVDPGVKVTAIAKALSIDKSAALRRVCVAIEDGYPTNLKERKGRPARIVLGDPLPEERTVLPHPDVLAGDRGGSVISSVNRATVQLTEKRMIARGWSPGSGASWKSLTYGQLSVFPKSPSPGRIPRGLRRKGALVREPAPVGARGS
jgi:hypothetical protein